MMENNKMNISETDAALVSLYQRWLDELKASAPYLLDNDSNYSNPYYISTPADWYSGEKAKILIVGEEGAGTWGAGKQDHSINPDEYTKIQEWNRSYLAKQLGQIPLGETAKNVSPFWRRLRAISEYGVCAWSNIDKIHKLGKSRCALSTRDRTALHSTQTLVLAEEIKIMQPSIVVFFGWYGISLQHELPELFDELYPNGLKGGWLGNLVSLENNGTHFIFTYHPAWQNKPANYENDVLEAINLADMAVRKSNDSKRNRYE